MHRPDARPLPMQRPADMHQAGVVASRDDFGLRIQHTTNLVGQHRARDLCVLDRERPAESAAAIDVGKRRQRQRAGLPRES